MGYMSQRRAVLMAGLLLVVAWTVLRFFIQPVIFDASGQQLLAHQWLQGYHGGSQTGPANYIFKMLAVYMPVDLLPGSPFVKLVLMTIGFNALTFLVLFWCLERLLAYFGVRDRRPLWPVYLWICAIAGSVFWIGFANSRNIEVAGGVLLMTLGLYVSAATARWKYGLIAVLCGALFFADPLQFYMSALPLLAYRWGDYALHRPKLSAIHPLLWLTGAIGAGYGLAQGLVVLVRHIWHVSFFSAGGALSPASLHMAAVNGVHALRQLLELYSGGTDLGRIFFYLNPVLVTVFLLAGVLVAVRTSKSRRPLIWAGVVVAINLLVYVVSGSPTVDTNARYLIMTLPAFAVAFAAVIAYADLPLRRGLVIAMVGVAAWGGLMLAYQLVRQYDSQLTKDRQYQVADTFMLQSTYQYAYAGMNTAIPTMYLYNSNVRLLPLSCQADGTVRLTNLFYDQAYMTQTRRLPAREVPVLLDTGDVMTNVPAVCTEQDIEAQLGAPLRVERLPDDTKALIYPAATMQRRLPL